MSTLCLGCMRPKENRPICEHCSFDERTDNLPHQLPIGTMLQNQYLVGRVLGQGGFGITYIGWDQNLSAPVAIKEYFPSGVVQRNTQWSTNVMCVNGEAPELFAKHRERFLKEARTLAQLSGIPEIVQVKSFFSANDTAYIVMEYVEGITLKQHLKQLGRPMTEPEVLSIMEPVLKALQKVHDKHLIHRDISPDNIMIQKDGTVKLIDFGTVRYMDDSGKSKSTAAVLKPGFAPIEQYNSRGNLGAWTDVYAICASFCYLLTGKVPPDVHERMDTSDQLALLSLIPSLSDKLIVGLRQGMQLRVSERIQTIEELYQILYSSGQTVPSIKQTQHTAKENSTAKKKSLHPVVFAAVAALAIGAGAWMLMKPASKPEAQPEDTKPVSASTAAAATESTPESTALFDPILDQQYSQATALEEAGEYAQAAIAFGKLGQYIDSRERSLSLWNSVADRKTLTADIWHTVGIRADGTVVTTGINRYGECNVSSWENIIAISNSSLDSDESGTPLGHTIGLKGDGTVVAAGNNEYEQCNVSDWTDIVAVTTNPYTSVGLKSDGTLVMTGSYTEQWQEALEWTDLIAVYAGSAHIVGLKADHTVIAAGSDQYSQCRTDAWRNIRKITAGEYHTIGIQEDGSVVIAGKNNTYGQPNVSSWKDISDLSTYRHVIGLREDGTVRSSGYVGNGADSVSGWRDIVAVSTSLYHTVGLKADGTVVACGWGYNGRCEVSYWTDMMLPTQASE